MLRNEGGLVGDSSKLRRYMNKSGVFLDKIRIIFG